MDPKPQTAAVEDREQQLRELVRDLFLVADQLPLKRDSWERQVINRAISIMGENQQPATTYAEGYEQDRKEVVSEQLIHAAKERLEKEKSRPITVIETGALEMIKEVARAEGAKKELERCRSVLLADWTIPVIPRVILDAASRRKLRESAIDAIYAAEREEP